MQKILCGDWIEQMRGIADKSVHCCVTSPPYFRLRNYGHDGQVGLEQTPREYIDKLVSGFSEVHRVLRDDGTLWVNLGDSYASTAPGSLSAPLKQDGILSGVSDAVSSSRVVMRCKNTDGIKPKDLIGIPWMFAFAMRDYGWYLRQEIIWAKKNCMPESVKDRCTRSHETIFMFSKKPKYYYDYEAIMEPAVYDVDGTGTAARKARQNDSNKLLPDAMKNGIRKAGFKDAGMFSGKHSDKQRGHSKRHDGFNDRWDKMSKEEQCTGMRNKRDVWNVATSPYDGAHFAVFPPKLIEPCILVGCPEGGTVLDPFGGSGTTAMVAAQNRRGFIVIELNPEYIPLIHKRLNGNQVKLL